MDRFTEKFKDGRNILLKGIDDTFHVGFDRFFEGDSVDKLAEYEDLEEQGKLLKLPCAVGNTVYRINKGKKEPIIPMRVIGIAIRNENELVIQTKDIADDNHNLYSKNSISKTVFLTKEAAESALEEMSELQGKDRENE